MIDLPTETCDAFRNCIKSFIQRKKKRIIKQLSNNNSRTSTTTGTVLPKGYIKQCQLASHLTSHAIHILTTLYIKRHSLSLGIDAFEIIVKECVVLLQRNLKMYENSKNNISQSSSSSSSSRSSFSKFLQRILTHLFIQYIHLRDGFVLLTSGECRHTADSELAARSSKDVASTTSGRKRKLTDKDSYNDDNDNDDNDNHSCENNNQSFSSKLNELSVREDGYTKLFSSNCGYSGYGWDEFFNEEVGVRNRLLEALRYCSSLKLIHQLSSLDGESSSSSSSSLTLKAKEEREKIWEHLVDSYGGAELFETAFDSQDNSIKELQQKLERLRTQMLHQLRQILSSSSVMLGSGSCNNNVTLSMVTEDKFERLHVKNAKVYLGLETWILERQGDAFKGKDDRGALPSKVTLQDWLEIMKIPSDLKMILEEHDNQSFSRHNEATKRSNSAVTDGDKKLKKKKKLTIVESSDEEEVDDDIDENNNYKFLKVTKTKVDATAPNSSLSEIKEQLGVNAHDLQRSREGLEQEERISKKAAFIDETGEGVDDTMPSEANLYGPTSSTTLSHNENIESHHSDTARFSSGNMHGNAGKDVEFTLRSKLDPNESSFPRNDLFRNASSSTNREPTSRIIIGGDYRHSTYQQKKTSHHLNNKNHHNNDEIDRAFRNFGEENNEERDHLFEEREDSNAAVKAIKYRKWGDELLVDLGIDLKSYYPSCAPEKPPEMIKEK